MAAGVQEFPFFVILVICRWYFKLIYFLATVLLLLTADPAVVEELACAFARCS